jgi:dipeptidyl aminopeptidase/acylaminoacyl peptidase
MTIPQFSPDGQTIYFTAGDEGRVKVYTLPVPATPSSSTTHPSLPPQYNNPLALTHQGFATGLHALPNSRVVFSRTTGTSPNDVFIVDSSNSEESHGLHQVTRFTEADLKDKKLQPYEEFWFEGAEGKKVQGWLVKPRGWTKDDAKKKWPVVLVIHGGTLRCFDLYFLLLSYHFTGPQSAWEDSWSTRWNPEGVSAEDR